MTTQKAPTPTESVAQQHLFAWAAFQSAAHPELALMYHIPNGGSRHRAEAANLQRQGVKAGVPDICLPVARGGYHGLYIELKREETSKISPAQVEWLESLSKQGYVAVVCHGYEMATRAILKYLHLKNEVVKK